MRNTALILILTVFMAVSAHAQFHGHCGDFRYTIEGKLISSVDVNEAGNNNSITVKTYYKVDEKNEYIWFWIEETEAGKVRVGKYISLWTRLSELSTNSFDNNKPSEILVRLKSDQQFFFTTMYTTQKKGPQYEVRNKFLIRFKNDREAIAFADEVKQFVPVFN